MKTKTTRTKKSPSKLLQWLTPQPRLHRDALCYNGKKKSPGFLVRMLNKYPRIIWIERIATILFFIYCIYVNDLRMFLMITVFWTVVRMSGELQFLRWYFKVYVFQRKFYERRRYFYNQGTLPYRFHTVGGSAYRRKHRFPSGHIIWASNQKTASKQYQKIKEQPPKEIM